MACGAIVAQGVSLLRDCRQGHLSVPWFRASVGVKGGHARLFPDEMPPRGQFILPENLILVVIGSAGGAIIAGGAILY